MPRFTGELTEGIIGGCHRPRLVAHPEWGVGKNDASTETGTTEEGSIPRSATRLPLKFLDYFADAIPLKYQPAWIQAA